MAKFYPVCCLRNHKNAYDSVNNTPGCLFIYLFYQTFALSAEIHQFTFLAISPLTKLGTMENLLTDCIGFSILSSR